MRISHRNARLKPNVEGLLQGIMFECLLQKKECSNNSERVLAFLSRTSSTVKSFWRLRSIWKRKQKDARQQMDRKRQKLAKQTWHHSLTGRETMINSMIWHRTPAGTRVLGNCSNKCSSPSFDNGLRRWSSRPVHYSRAEAQRQFRINNGMTPY